MNKPEEPLSREFLLARGYCCHYKLIMTNLEDIDDLIKTLLENGNAFDIPWTIVRLRRYEEAIKTGDDYRTYFETLITQLAKQLNCATDSKAIGEKVEELLDFKEINSIKETCQHCGHAYNTSWVESGWCMPCILKKTKAERNSCREKAEALDCLEKEEELFTFGSLDLDWNKEEDGSLLSAIQQARKETK